MHSRTTGSSGPGHGNLPRDCALAADPGRHGGRGSLAPLPLEADPQAEARGQGRRTTGWRRRRAPQRSSACWRPSAVRCGYTRSTECRSSRYCRRKRRCGSSTKPPRSKCPCRRWSSVLINPPRDGRPRPSTSTPPHALRRLPPARWSAPTAAAIRRLIFMCFMIQPRSLSTACVRRQP